jgi:hypothetical protein
LRSRREYRRKPNVNDNALLKSRKNVRNRRKRLKKLEDKKKGLYISEKNKTKIEKLKMAREQFEKMKQGQDEDSDDSSSEEEKPAGTETEVLNEGTTVTDE